MRISKAIYLAGVLAAVLTAFGIGRLPGRTDHALPGAASVALAETSKSVKQTGAVSKPSPAEAAIKAAAARKRYVFITFYKKNDDLSNKMLAAMKSARSKLSNRANFITANVDDPVNRSLVERYDVAPASVPLTLALAPNGAITMGYSKQIETAELSKALVSTGLADVLKVLQNGKLAVVCLQSSKTKFNKESLAAAGGLRADSRLSGKAEVIKIDPSNSGESAFMQMCKVDTKAANAQVLLIVPPGRVIGKFDGNTTKDKLMANLQRCLSSCGSGCGPSGCGP